MTKVKMLASLYDGDELVKAGTTADLPAELAALWLAQGYAEPVAEKQKTPDK